MPALVVVKTDGRAAPEAHEHEARPVDGQKNNAQGQIAQRYPHCVRSPPLERRLLGREHTGQCPREQQQGQGLPDTPIVEKREIHTAQR